MFSPFTALNPFEPHLSVLLVLLVRFGRQSLKRERGELNCSRQQFTNSDRKISDLNHFAYLILSFDCLQIAARRIGNTGQLSAHRSSLCINAVCPINAGIIRDHYYIGLTSVTEFVLASSALLSLSLSLT